MVWDSRQDRMGNLPGLWPILPGEARGDDPTQTPSTVESHRSRCGRGLFRLDGLSFPA
jgi:hypothetical protein